VGPCIVGNSIIYSKLLPKFSTSARLTQNPCCVPFYFVASTIHIKAYEVVKYGFELFTFSPALANAFA